MVSMLSEIWFGLFIPDPEPDFLTISDPGVKNTGSRIRNTETSPCRPRGTSEEDNGIQILLQKKAKPKSPTPLVTCQLDIFALCRIEWRCRLPFELGLPGIPDPSMLHPSQSFTYLYILDLDMQKPEQWALSNKPWQQEKKWRWGFALIVVSL